MNKPNIEKKRPDWYLTNLIPKKSYEWTPFKMKQIYTLKKTYDLPAKAIASLFNIEVTQVYNTTRLVTRAYRKECFTCGKKLSENDLIKNKKHFIKACTKCKEKAQQYKRNRRQTALKKGLCGHCEKRNIIPGHTSCKECISITYRRRYKKKLCGRCGKHPLTNNSYSLCQYCLKKNREKTKKNKKNKVNV